jgi:hypothetical protein
MTGTNAFWIKRLIAGLIGCGLGLLLVRATGWDENLRWVASGIPIMTSTIAIVLVIAWQARRAK